MCPEPAASRLQPPSLPCRVLGPSAPAAPPQPRADGDPDLKLPIPPSLSAEVFTRKDPGGTEHGDGTEDFLTEGEDERPRGLTETGPGGGEETRGDQEPVLKRRKVSGSFPCRRFSVSSQNLFKEPFCGR